MIEKAYTYKAKTPKGKIISGVVYAPSYPLAFNKLKRAGFTPLEAKLNVSDTVNAIGQKDFLTPELARLYQTLGRRLNNGKSILDGLEGSVEYLADPKLKQAAMLMRQSIADGQTTSEAMLNAGFPKRDAMVIRATEESGRTGATFLALSAELKRTDALRRGMAAIFRMPKIMGIMMLVLMYGALVGIAPETMKFFEKTGIKMKMNAFTDFYFELAKVVNENVFISTVIYLSIPLGLIYLHRIGLTRSLLDKMKRVRDVSVKSDHVTLWASFNLMYDASVPVKEVCRMVAKSAKREDSTLSFNRMAKLIEGGQSLEEAIGKVGFPDFVVAQVKSATSSGDIVMGLNEMVTNLDEDVNTSMQILQENAKVWSILVSGVGITLLFFMSYFPILSSVLSNI